MKLSDFADKSPLTIIETRHRLLEGESGFCLLLMNISVVKPVIAFYQLGSRLGGIGPAKLLESVGPIMNDSRDRFYFYRSLDSTFAAVDGLISELSLKLCPWASVHMPGLQFSIQTAVRELAINAVEHGNRMNSARKVTVEVEASLGSVSVYVGDEGPGFEPPGPENCPELDNPERDRRRGCCILLKMGWELVKTSNGICATLRSGASNQEEE